jgi:2-dehydro-3-deoxyglucarate aldolase/4-hydroxy-2-oxoheptanedioate aldolase
VPTVDDAVDLHGQGFDFICYSGDVWALQGAVSAGLTEIRERTAKRAEKGKAKDRAGKKKKK